VGGSSWQRTHRRHWRGGVGHHQRTAGRAGLGTTAAAADQMEELARRLRSGVLSSHPVLNKVPLSVLLLTSATAASQAHNAPTLDQYVILQAEAPHPPAEAVHHLHKVGLPRPRHHHPHGVLQPRCRLPQRRLPGCPRTVPRRARGTRRRRPCLSCRLAAVARHVSRRWRASTPTAVGRGCAGAGACRRRRVLTHHLDQLVHAAIQAPQDGLRVHTRQQQSSARSRLKPRSA